MAEDGRLKPKDEAERCGRTFRSATSATSARLGSAKLELTRSSAFAVIADRTAYDVRYSYRPLSGLAVVSIYLFTVSN